jgi:hypothetical protein
LVSYGGEENGFQTPGGKKKEERSREGGLNSGTCGIMQKYMIFKAFYKFD